MTISKLNNKLIVIIIKLINIFLRDTYACVIKFWVKQGNSWHKIQDSCLLQGSKKHLMGKNITE